MQYDILHLKVYCARRVSSQVKRLPSAMTVRNGSLGEGSFDTMSNVSDMDNRGNFMCVHGAFYC